MDNNLTNNGNNDDEQIKIKRRKNITILYLFLNIVAIILISYTTSLFLIYWSFDPISKDFYKLSSFVIYIIIVFINFLFFQMMYLTVRSFTMDEIYEFYDMWD